MTVTGRWDWSRVDVAVPLGPSVPGIRMAGFRYREDAPVDITMIPHPLVTVLLDLSEHGVVHDVSGGRVTGNAVIGLRAGAFRITSAGVGDVLQIRMSPVVAAAILRDTDIIGGAVAPLTELWGPATTFLIERLRATPSWDDRFAITAAFLRSRFPRKSGVAPELAYVWDRTVRAGGRVRIHTLATETGWTRQRLWSRFRTQLGVSPRHASELVRFDRAAHLLAGGRPLAEVAAEAGYADQSHLHRRTRAATGTTPTVVARAPWLAIDDLAWPTT
ncbi:AraC family transcriptional regulator [Nocardia caishijiensis]|uniref:Helix-turn-helix protein n=1 Tax=Nocardia caishijiensis TaxID=184756 RepID=A0ABQ6YIU0_9NOCA|nr:helix-turn-helix domain-containing protein [Nocardia caishijiensis]KAF0845553.1 helix-turn-helix protein [Nocardia caishijiensis]